jgi:2-aminoadipate transaminase
VTAPGRYWPRCCSSKQAADLCGSNFAQVTAERYFRARVGASVLQNLTRTYAERRDAMLEALEEHFPPRRAGRVRKAASSSGSSCRRSSTAGAMLAEAVEHGVTFVPGTAFYPDGRGRNCMRLAFCYAEPEAITEGIRRLAEVIEDRLELYRAFIAAGRSPEEGAPAVTEGVA